MGQGDEEQRRHQSDRDRSAARTGMGVGDGSHSKQTDGSVEAEESEQNLASHQPSCKLDRVETREQSTPRKGHGDHSCDREERECRHTPVHRHLAPSRH